MRPHGFAGKKSQSLMGRRPRPGYFAAGCTEAACRDVSVPAECRKGRLGHRLGCNAEVPIEILVRRAGAETGHADKATVAADDLVPTLADRRLDADSHGCVADHVAPDIVRRREEQFEARHRHDARRNAAANSSDFFISLSAKAKASWGRSSCWQ